MASNEDVFLVAEGLLDEQQYLTENLAEVDAVVRYADSIGIKLSTSEANKIIGVVREYLTMDDGQWEDNYFWGVKSPLLFWDREEAGNEV